MTFGRVVLLALVLSATSAGLIALVSRTPAEVRAPQSDVSTETPTFTEAQVARHGAFRGPLYLAFGLSLATQIAFLILLRGRPIAQLVERAEASMSGWPGRAAVVAIVVSASFALIALPLRFVTGYSIQKAWHLSNQDLGAWLLDQTKGAGLGLVFAAVAAVAFFAIVRWPPQWWWLWGATTFTALTAVLVFLWPVVVAPLFNRFTPLDDRVLAARIETLADRAGVAVDEVLVADASKRSSAENAYVAGLGTTRRVVLYDTLLEAGDADETLFVVAHELAHEAEDHVLKGVAVSAAGLLIGFVVLYRLASSDKLLEWVGAGAITDLRVLPALLLFAVVAGLVAQPFQSAISRSFEARADAIAFELIEDPDPAIRAFRRLAISNIADLRPPAAAVWMFYSHPPVADRIQAARATAARKP